MTIPQPMVTSPVYLPTGLGNLRTLIRANSHARGLPSQQQYLKTLGSSRLQSEPPRNQDKACAICLDPVTDPHSTCDMLLQCKGGAIIETKPCGHLFHHCCIVQWHCTARPERNTCPECRCELFIAENLTYEQIRQLTDDALPIMRIDALDQLAATDMMIPDDLSALRRLARHRLSMYLRRGQPMGYFWPLECEVLRDKLLETLGPVRSVFTQHTDTFVIVLIAATLLFEIARWPHLTRRPDFQRFVDWVDYKMDTMAAEGVYEELYTEFRTRGLFMADGWRITQITLVHVQYQLELVSRIRLVSAEMEARTRESAWRRGSRRLAHISVCGVFEFLLEKTYHKNQTLAGLFTRMSLGEQAHMMSNVAANRLSEDALAEVTRNGVFSLHNAHSSQPTH